MVFLFVIFLDFDVFRFRSTLTLVSVTRRSSYLATRLPEYLTTTPFSKPVGVELRGFGGRAETPPTSFLLRIQNLVGAIAICYPVDDKHNKEARMQHQGYASSCSCSSGSRPSFVIHNS